VRGPRLLRWHHPRFLIGPGLALLAAAMPAAARAQTLPPPERVSLGQAVALALSHDPDLRVDRLDVERSGLGVVRESASFWTPRFVADVGFIGEKLPVPNGSLDGVAGHNLFTLRVGLEGRTPIGTQYGLSLGTQVETLDSALVNLSPAYTQRIEFRLVQPLLRGGFSDANQLALRVAEREQRVTRAQLQVRVAQIVFGVVEAYWALHAAREERVVRLRARQLAEEQRDIAGRLVRRGARSALDVIQAESVTAARNLEVLQSEQTIVVAETNLLRRLNLWRRDGLYRQTGELIPTEQPRNRAGAPQFEATVRTALARRPELEVAKAILERERVRHAAARNATLPRLDLRARVGALGFQGTNSVATCRAFRGVGLNPNDPQTNSILDASCPPPTPQLVGDWTSAWSTLSSFPFGEIGLSLEVPLDNRPARSDARAAEIDVEKQDERMRMVQRDLVLEVRAALKLLAGERGRVRGAEKGVDLAEQNLTAEKKKFAAGVSTNFDVLRVQGELTQARLELVRSLAALSVAVARVDLVSGTLLEKNRISLSAR
jgi:outer membrane protein TolC